MTFLFVTSQLWLGLPPHGSSPPRSCLCLELFTGELHLVYCLSPEFRNVQGTHTPQVHAHVGRTRAPKHGIEFLQMEITMAVLGDLARSLD